MVKKHVNVVYCPITHVVSTEDRTELQRGDVLEMTEGLRIVAFAVGHHGLLRPLKWHERLVVWDIYLVRGLRALVKAFGLVGPQ